MGKGACAAKAKDAAEAPICNALAYDQLQQYAVQVCLIFEDACML